MAHPYLAKDADVGCRHLCIIRSVPSRKDDAAMAEFMSTAPYQGQPLTLLAMPIDPHEIWRLVK